MRNKKIKTIFYKNTWVEKKNLYTWCGIVDKNGRMLKSHLLPETFEFLQHITEVTQAVSEVLIDAAMYDFGIHKKMNRFFKLVHPTLHASYFKKTKRDRGRYKGENIYLFQNYYDAFYNTETFFKGVLWIMTSLENFQNIYPYIDKVRVLRINHDFVEMFGENSCEAWNFNDIIDDVFVMNETLRSKISDDLKQLSKLKKTKIETTKEIADNGMVFIKSNEAEKQKQKKDIPDIFDYCFECYRRNHTSDDSPIEAVRKRQNQFKKAKPGEHTMAKKNLSRVLR